MKISEVTIDEIKDYANVDHNFDDDIFENILMAAKSYIKGYTGLDNEQVDEKEDLTLALMILCNEMYDNRMFTVQSDKVNIVVSNILNMHSINLL